jgi:RNA polymerase sigma-70 factor, ECF subfamily
VDDLIRLIEPSIPSLRRYARALVRDATEADDLVQDCLERAIGRWGQRKEASDARSWLFSILHNLAISRWRRLSRRGEKCPWTSSTRRTWRSAPPSRTA